MVYWTSQSQTKTRKRGQTFSMAQGAEQEIRYSEPLVPYPIPRQTRHKNKRKWFQWGSDGAGGGECGDVKLWPQVGSQRPSLRKLCPCCSKMLNPLRQQLFCWQIKMRHQCYGYNNHFLFLFAGRWWYTLIILAHGRQRQEHIFIQYI